MTGVFRIHALQHSRHKPCVLLSASSVALWERGTEFLFDFVVFKLNYLSECG